MRRRARRSTTRNGRVVRPPPPSWHSGPHGTAAGARVRERMTGMPTGGDPDAGIRCDRLVELVTDYLEGALDEAVAAEFDPPRDGSRGCAAYVDQMRQPAHQLGQVSLHGLPDAARARLLEAFGDLLG